MRLTDETHERLHMVARDPETSPKRLAWLVDGPSMWIAEAAASNPSLPEQAIVGAVRDAIEHGYGDLLYELASNPNLPKDLIPEMIPHGNSKCLWMLAEQPGADLAMLTAIYKRAMATEDGEWRSQTLAAIVGHPSCSIDLLRDVLKGEVEVSSGLLPGAVDLSPGLMTRCMERNDVPSDVIDRVAELWNDAYPRYKSPTSFYEALANKKAVELGKLIADHPNTSLPLLTLLAVHSDPRLAEPALAQLHERRRASPELFDEDPPDLRQDVDS